MKIKLVIFLSLVVFASCGRGEKEKVVKEPTREEIIQKKLKESKERSNMIVNAVETINEITYDEIVNHLKENENMDIIEIIELIGDGKNKEYRKIEKVFKTTGEKYIEKNDEYIEDEIVIEMGAIIEVSGTGETAQIENTLSKYVKIKDQDEYTKYKEFMLWDLPEYPLKKLYIVGIGDIIRTDKSGNEYFRKGVELIIDTKYE